MKPKALILRTAGTNCDKETEFAFQQAGAATLLSHINRLKVKNELSECQILAIPGGFSYGDDLGAGKIFSLEFHLWLREGLRQFIAKGGLIIGICNGFQVLVKTGILPDADFTQKVTLDVNDSNRFEARWTYLKVIDHSVTKPQVKNIWLNNLPEVIALPVAHGEGKFYAEKEMLDTIETHGQIVLQYVDERGHFSGYPSNPNGSLRHIAGITDSTGKIFGLMPHPERFMFSHHWPYWREQKLEPFGLQIFKNAVNYFK